MPRKGTVMDIPVDSLQSDETKRYLVQFDDSTVLSVPLAEMPDMVLKPPTSPVEPDSDHLPPPPPGEKESHL